MTGVNINKIRHYAPGFNSRTTRLDADAAALTFKAGNRIISTSERLIADVSVKVAMPTSPNTDGKKRGLEDANSKKYVNYGGMVFDPEGKKQEGSYFKHYVTESERIDALRSENPVPNWGWINPGDPGNQLPKPRTAVAKVTRYPVNPKTGEPMKSQGFEPELKSLGRTIGERNPGAKLAARAAKAMGLVIDSLGKFRCPPGTPAANRFTNERGEGCFGVSAGQIQSIAESLSNIMSGPRDGSRLAQSLMNIGVSAYEIRKAYKENGFDGLRSLASRAGVDGGPLVGDEGIDDPSYFSTVVARVKEVMNATSGAEARMSRIRDEKNRVISELKDKYGITETDEYLALGQIFKAMEEDDSAPFGPGQFEKLFMGGSPESHKNWVIETTVQMHMGVIMRNTGLTNPAEVIDAYEKAKERGLEDTLTRFIDAAIQREEKYRIGAFKEILKEATLRPETFKAQNGVPHEIVVDHGRLGRDDFTTLNGMAGPGWTHIGSGAAIKGFRDAPPPGYMDLYEATDGDMDDQWRAITDAMSSDEQARRWVQTYSTDLAAENGAGWEDFGAQTAAHENTHSKQYNAIVQYLKEAYPDEKFDEMSNGDLWLRIDEFIKVAGPEELSAVFGIDLDELIERRLDALAGQYSQDEQQRALAALTSGDRDAFNRAKNIAFLETHAELNANREVGLIGDNPEIDEVLDAFMPMSDVPDSVPPPPSGLVIPGAPAHWGPLIIPGAPEPDGGELIIPGRRPDRPIDAPEPVRPGDSARPTRPGRRPARPLPDSAPSLPEGAGRIIEPRPTTPAGRTPRGPGRAPRGPVDPFERDRHGKVPRMIREGRFTTDDIDEHLYGEDGKGGLWGMFRSAKNMRISNGENRERDRKRKELLNNLIDTMGVSFDELEEMALKARRGEPLTSEEKQKLTAAITHLRNGANEFKRKAEEARERFQNYVPEAIDPRDQWDDVSVNRANLEAIQKEIEMYESLFQRVGRGFAPAVHDILTISENGPYPDSLVPRNRNLDLVRRGSPLSAEEIEVIDSISDNPPNSYLSSSSAPDLEFELESNAEVLGAFRRHGMDSSSSVSDRDIDSAVPAMKALDKTTVDEDIVVEIEIDSPEDTEPGAIYSMPSIQTASVLDDDEQRSGLASFSGSGSVTAGVVGRLLGSKRGRELIERVGVNPEQADVVQLIGEMAIGFSAGGPAGAIIPLARRGGRDAGEKALEVMVERGMIDQSVADKITKYGLDRIASEGLPDEIVRAAEATTSRLLTEENRRKALEMGAVFQERSIELAEATKEKTAELAGAAKEQIFEVAGSARERFRRRREGREKPNAVGPGTPAGWNPDPSKPGQYRYFNGQVWTEHVSDSSGVQSIDNNPLLGNQPGWSEYQAGVSAARSGGVSNDPFADDSTPDAFSTPSISDPFADYSPESPEVPSVPYNDPFEDLFEEPRAGGLASSSRGAKAAGKRITKNFRVDGKPRKKPETRQELISRAVPTTASELMEIIENSPFTQGKKSKEQIFDLINMMEIDWAAQAKLSSKLERTLSDSPGFEELLGEFDIPPMIVTKNGAKPGMFNRDSMYQDSSRWDSIEGEYFPEYGFVAFPPRVINQEEIVTAAVDWPIPTDDVLRHELSHTIHAMAMGKSRKARKRYEQDTAEQIDRLEEAISYAEESGLEKIDLIDYALSSDDQSLAGEISRYAMTKKSEYIAELMTYMFPGKKTKFFVPKEEHFQMLSEFLDIPIDKLKELHSKSLFSSTPFV